MKRGYINIKDTVRCIELAITNAPKNGEYRVFNQITEQFTISELAHKVQKAAAEIDVDVEIVHLENPRIEAEKHYYNANYTRLLDLGLEPHYLDNNLLKSLIQISITYADRINSDFINPSINWRHTGNKISMAPTDIQDIGFRN